MSEKIAKSSQENSLNAFVSISEALKPEYWNMQELNFEVDSNNLEFADAEKFASNLYDLKPRQAKKFSLVYYKDHIDPRQQEPVSVVLIPEEYNMLLRSRSPKALSEIAMSRTIAANDYPSIDNDQAKALRSGRYALNNKLAVMETYRDKTILNDVRILDRLLEATKYPNLLRGKQINMLTDMSWAMDHILGNMFEALRYQKKWSNEQEELAKKTTYRRIFFEGSDTTRIKYFNDLLKVNKNWLVRKKYLIDERTNSIKIELSKYND